MDEAFHLCRPAQTTNTRQNSCVVAHTDSPSAVVVVRDLLTSRFECNSDFVEPQRRPDVGHQLKAKVRKADFRSPNYLVSPKSGQHAIHSGATPVGLPRILVPALVHTLMVPTRKTDRSAFCS